MGRGIDLAKTLSSNPEGVKALDDLKEQLIIVLVKRLGGAVDVSLKEMDDTGSDNLMMGLTPESMTFHFEVRSEDSWLRSQDEH